MEVTFTLTKDEMRQVVRVRQATARQLFKAFLLLAVFVGSPPLFLIVLEELLRGESLHHFLSQLGSALRYFALTLMLIVGRLYWQFGRKKRTGYNSVCRNPDLLQPQTIGIGPESFYVRTSKEDSLCRWEGVHRIVTDEAFLVVVIAQDSAVLVPLRAFPTPEAAHAFVAQAQSYWTAAQVQPPLIPRPDAP